MKLAVTAEVMMTLLKVILHTFVLTSICAELMCTDRHNHKHVHYGKILPNPAFLVMKTSGVLQCTRSCLLRNLCKSFNFDTVSGECQLIYQSINTTSELESAEDFVFSDISSWSNRLAGTCAGHSCPLNTFCDPVDANNYSCVTEGCLRTPSVEGGASQSSTEFFPIGSNTSGVCDNGFAPQGETVCQQNGTWSFTSCVALRSCSMVKEFFPESTDGEYWLIVTDQLYKSKMYCHNMSLSTPIEYLTLTNPNYGHYPQVRNYHCNRETRELGGGCAGQGGEIWFSKLKVVMNNTQSLEVNIYDFEFVNFTNSLRNLAYGKAFDCYTPHDNELSCGVKGLFIVDLRGTGWRIDENQEWELVGWRSYMMPVQRELNGTLITLRCGGYGGGCKPKDGLFLVPNM